MANELNVLIGEEGKTVTARFIIGGLLSPTIISCPEVPGLGGYYSGSMPPEVAGLYHILFYADDRLRASGTLDWNGTAEALVSDVDVTVDAIKAKTDNLPVDPADQSDLLTAISAVVGGSAITVEEIVTALSSATIVVQSPVYANGTSVTIIHGDTYDPDDGSPRTISWTIPSPTYSLIGATAAFILGGYSFPLVIDGNVLTLTLTAIQTATIPGSTYRYHIRLTLASSHIVTPITGRLTVIPLPD